MNSLWAKHIKGNGAQPLVDSWMATHHMLWLLYEAIDIIFLTLRQKTIDKNKENLPITQCNELEELWRATQSRVSTLFLSSRSSPCRRYCGCELRNFSRYFQRITISKYRLKSPSQTLITQLYSKHSRFSSNTKPVCITEQFPSNSDHSTMADRSIERQSSQVSSSEPDK